jgi:hypothetical protein
MRSAASKESGTVEREARLGFKCWGKFSGARISHRRIQGYSHRLITPMLCAMPDRHRDAFRNVRPLYI